MLFPAHGCIYDEWLTTAVMSVTYTCKSAFSGGDTHSCQAIGPLRYMETWAECLGVVAPLHSSMQRSSFVYESGDCVRSRSRVDPVVKDPPKSVRFGICQFWQ